MSLYLGTTPITPAVSDVANQSLSNLNSTGKNIANWSSNVTNCLVEVPQDINLELSSGTLTLKAGSKVYVPNGFEQDGTTQKFDEITIENDISLSGSTSGANTVRLLYYREGNVDISVYANHSSGTTPPTSGTNQIFYNTSDNTIKRYTNGSVVETSYSLPIAIITEDDTYLCGSIDQVFNGFGELGSTVFGLPGVKGLMPNGRLPDGTLNNTEFTITTVLTATRTWNRQAGVDQLIAYMSGGIWFYNGYFTSETEPEVVAYSFWYNPKSNVLYYRGSAGGWTPVQGVAPILYCGGDGTTKINGISRIKDTFRAVDWSDRPTVSGWAMPSDKYVDLTLGSSGATYTAPANGYFAASKESTGNGQYLFIDGSLLGTGSRSTGSGQTVEGYLPVRAGDTVKVTYNAGGSTNYFRFIYAEGN